MASQNSKACKKSRKRMSDAAKARHQNKRREGDAI